MFGTFWLYYHKIDNDTRYYNGEDCLILRNINNDCYLNSYQSAAVLSEFWLLVANFNVINLIRINIEICRCLCSVASNFPEPEQCSNPACTYISRIGSICEAGVCRAPGDGCRVAFIVPSSSLCTASRLLQFYPLLRHTYSFVINVFYRQREICCLYNC